MWIKHVAYGQAAGRLRQLYDRVKGPDDNVDNIMLAHSLRPHTMEGHMTLYKHVLHHASNTTPKWFLETIGVHVSLLNSCSYCVEHHFAGLSRLLGNQQLADQIRTGLGSGHFSDTGLNEAQQAALAYATFLTSMVSEQTALQKAVETMRALGWDDGGILEINQVTAYFNYANRTVLGLGVTTDGDLLGLSPGNSDNPDDWQHG